MLVQWGIHFFFSVMVGLSCGGDFTVAAHHFCHQPRTVLYGTAQNSMLEILLVDMGKFAALYRKSSGTVRMMLQP
ncbi:hypothetical protein L873DRAFT_1442934 [Choiromyces venosus 120613-1]|uniref:Uncharacterized protein n=1 Tax=Choiromyces venosus 120613-1 TaxID=1336337 RepID=A0A3N4J7N2_9PEZI|nr:hypothetical protein L873DRAFT_1442934 [Choiromyces venosus 120613-1]